MPDIIINVERKRSKKEIKQARSRRANLPQQQLLLEGDCNVLFGVFKAVVKNTTPHNSGVKLLLNNNAKARKPKEKFYIKSNQFGGMIYV